MKTNKITPLLVIAVTANFAFAQSEPSPQTAEVSNSYEELPELQANSILRPEILAGPHHKVREPVPTYSGTNHFTIDSEWLLIWLDAEGRFHHYQVTTD